MNSRAHQYERATTHTTANTLSCGEEDGRKIPKKGYYHLYMAEPNVNNEAPYSPIRVKWNQFRYPLAPKEPLHTLPLDDLHPLLLPPSVHADRCQSVSKEVQLSLSSTSASTSPASVDLSEKIKRVKLQTIPSKDREYTLDGNQK